jgi:hypothetical protein
MTGNGDLLDAWAIVRNQPIFYRRSEIVDGRRVLVHLHGFAISGSYMVPTARLLVDEFTTFVPDLPGFGRSLNPDHVLTIDELADSVAAFLDQVGVDRAYWSRRPEECTAGRCREPSGSSSWTLRESRCRWLRWPCRTTSGSAWCPR